MPDILVFDMDGVLVEVSESYRETVVQTVHRLSGKTITRELIQDYKNQGGWNNDWALSQKIAADMGVNVEPELRWKSADFLLRQALRLRRVLVRVSVACSTRRNKPTCTGRRGRVRARGGDDKWDERADR